MAFMKDTSQIARRMMQAARPPPQPPKMGKSWAPAIKKGGKVAKPKK